MKGLNRALTGLVISVITLIAVLPAAADKAKSLYSQGSNAEVRQDYQKAYEFYKQAYELNPKDATYRASFERLKFLAAAAHVHTGQQLREDGKLAEALVEFTAALKIDPASFIAQQEIRRTKEMLDQANNPEAKPQARGLSEKLNQAAAPAELAPISDQPITLRMSEDTKVIYETVGKLAGVNVLFDPDYTSRRIRIELNSVTLNQALEMIALQSKTFWRPVTSNTIYIAADTKAKRTEIEQQVLRTFYISNLSQATELQDIQNALRTVLELTRLQALPTQGAIVVRGTPDQILLAEKLINDIDKARPEVVVDVYILQISRDKTRKLGISPPGSVSVAINENSSSSTSSSSTSTSSSDSTGTISLNSLASLDARNFTVSIPSASANFLLTDTSTKVVQSPQIRALDGQKASLKIGQRIPVATGSYSSSTISTLVNTQFQYIDVGVNVDITPHIFSNRDVGLKVVLEVSSQTGTSTLGSGSSAITEPIIGQRKVEHEIRLKEGEVNLLGGMNELSDSLTKSGIPVLSQIPVLKYLFGTDTKEKVNTEIVFMLVPHVVRAQDLSDMNQRTLDIGTANTIHVRRISAPATGNASATAPSVNSPAAQSAPVHSQPVQQTAPQAQVPGVQQAANISPAPAPTAASPSIPTTGSIAAGGPLLSFEQPTINVATGQTFTVNVTLTGAQNVFSVPAQIAYDQRLLQLVNVSNGNAMSQDGQPVALVHRDDPNTGSVQITASRPPGANGISPVGTMFSLTFMAKAPGQAALAVNRAVLRDPAMGSTPASGSQAIVTVR